jgi:hypothetical protein
LLKVCEIQTEGNGFFVGLVNAIVTVTKDGVNLEKFQANYPNIRTLKGFLNGQWNLEPFDECFKGANRLGDVDASLEMSGHTLLVEFKGAKGGMNKGQVLKAIRQAKYTKLVTFFVFGKKDIIGYLKLNLMILKKIQNLVTFERI